MKKQIFLFFFILFSVVAIAQNGTKYIYGKVSSIEYKDDTVVIKYRPVYNYDQYLKSKGDESFVFDFGKKVQTLKCTADTKSNIGLKSIISQDANIVNVDKKALVLTILPEKYKQFYIERSAVINGERVQGINMYDIKKVIYMDAADEK